jgi:hypothetical protein
VVYFGNPLLPLPSIIKCSMANEMNALPLVYQCIFCDWRWQEGQPESYSTEYDAAIMFVGAGACPACCGPHAVDLRKAG